MVPSLRHRTPLSSDRIVNIHYTFLEVPIKSRSSGRTFCAPSVGAFVKCTKSIFYHLAEKLNTDATTSGHSWPSIKIPVSTSNPISCSQFCAVSTETRIQVPEWSWEVTFVQWSTKSDLMEHRDHNDLYMNATMDLKIGR